MGSARDPAAIDPETHDTILATVSHLPHVLANVLVSQAAAALEAGGERLPGDRPELPRRHARRWSPELRSGPTSTCRTADALESEVERTIEALERFRAALRDADADRISAWNEGAAADRRRLLEAQLAGAPLFELRASVPNRPGVVAQLALELGRAGVNIADMALYPAPDMSEGVVALWISGEQAARPRRGADRRAGLPGRAGVIVRRCAMVRA